MREEKRGELENLREILCINIIKYQVLLRE